MAGNSIYGIAERVCLITGRQGDIQAVTQLVIDSYSTVVKNEYYENKQDGISEIDGVFIYTFGKNTPLVPQLDSNTDEYYIDCPSSYLRLPHEGGVSWISLMKDTVPFIRVNGLWSPALKANALGGRQSYRTEGSRIYFPKMTNINNGNILLKMAIALDNVDVDEELNIPRSVIDVIVNLVVQKISGKPPEETKIND